MKASHLLSSIITTAIFLAAAAPAAGADAFVGTYKNDELTVDFLANTGAYTGTVKSRNQTFPLSATENSGALKGTFLSGDSKLAFKATLDGDSLTFTTDGTTYKLARQSTNRNPLAKPAMANPLTKSDAAILAVPGSRTNEPSGGPARGAAWKTYRHPTGLSMSYPPDWQLKEHPQMLQLVPSDAASNADGPTEAYFVFAEAPARSRWRQSRRDCRACR